VKKRVVNLVRQFRDERGMTQEELSRLSGVSRQSIISIESGRYTPSLLLALTLADIFECGTDDLFYLARRK
jgi:putative transcriptional regulator